MNGFQYGDGNPMRATIMWVSRLRATNSNRNEGRDNEGDNNESNENEGNEGNAMRMWVSPMRAAIIMRVTME